MTEAEWLGSMQADALIEGMYRHFPKYRLGSTIEFQFIERRLRLIAAAVGRKIEDLLKHDWHKLALLATEEIADNISREDEIRRAMSTLQDEQGWPSHFHNRHIDHAISSMVLPHESYEALASQMRSVNLALQTAWGDKTSPYPNDAELLRDIFGNPFRPVAFDPAWRTTTAVGVALAMYDTREFGAMPILADALQDAGCEDDAILAHCRDERQPHVRGCWVVDLVLGKV